MKRFLGNHDFFGGDHDPFEHVTPIGVRILSAFMRIHYVPASGAAHVFPRPWLARIMNRLT